MSSRKKMTSLFTTIAKFALVIVLLWWMIGSKKLDMQKLRILVQSYEVFTYNFLLWLIGCVILTSWRWGILLRGLQCIVTFKRTVQLSLVGLFFTSVMPGAIGGDLIKAFYVYKDQSSHGKKTPALLSIVLDRLIGLYSIFSIAIAVLLWNWTTLWSYDSLQPLLFALLAIFTAVSAFFAIVLSPSPRLHGLITAIFARIGIDTFMKIYEALRLFRDKPLYLAYAWLVSCIYQTALVLYYCFITALVSDVPVDYTLLAAVLPFAMIATALPIAPGGLGVGHVVFERLYNMVGIQNGANVFNIVFFGQLAFNLLGFLPFFMIKANNGIPNGSEQESM